VTKRRGSVDIMAQSGVKNHNVIPVLVMGYQHPTLPRVVREGRSRRLKKGKRGDVTGGPPRPAKT
jgi:hypothetical protein